MGTVGPNQDKIRGFPLLNSAHLVLQAESPGAVDGGHIQDVGGLQAADAAVDGVQQGHALHLPEEIAAVVPHGSVSAEADVDADAHHLRNGGNAVGDLHFAEGGVCHAGAGIPQLPDLPAVQIDDVGGDKLVVQRTVPVEEVHRARPEFPPHPLQAPGIFRQMAGGPKAQTPGRFTDGPDPAGLKVLLRDTAQDQLLPRRPAALLQGQELTPFPIYKDRSRQKNSGRISWYKW